MKMWRSYHVAKLLATFFATFPKPASIDIWLNNLNSMHKRIQFTKEINNSLAFLDVFIENQTPES